MHGDKSPQPGAGRGYPKIYVRRRGQFCLLTGLLILSGACTFKMTYRYADWLALWQIDHYFDLTQMQKEFLSKRLESVLARHRQRSLPKYERVMTQIREKFGNGLTEGDVDWFFAAYEELRDELFELFAADGADFLRSVDNEQLRYLEKTLSKSDEEIKTRLQENTELRLAKRAESSVDWLEDWLGPLTPEQGHEIRQWSVALPDTLEAWLEYRQHRQETFLRLIADVQSGEGEANMLREWLLLPYKDAPPRYLEAREQMRIGVSHMALSIDRMMTKAQRRHVLEELETIIEDLHDLSAA